MASCRFGPSDCAGTAQSCLGLNVELVGSCVTVYAMTTCHQSTMRAFPRLLTPPSWRTCGATMVGERKYHPRVSIYLYHLYTKTTEWVDKRASYFYLISCGVYLLVGQLWSLTALVCLSSSTPPGRAHILQEGALRIYPKFQEKNATNLD